ncbi:unnamed protein product [Ranitomeya imitator]|uniref:Uncharacterized protein n=1 Tax=Ranitomeya imitator TaxID=111125 RepID=A0ABN9KUB1_9NEOB|nr:unnamed protein product [Ranitomeya imitator]
MSRHRGKVDELVGDVYSLEKGVTMASVDWALMLVYGFFEKLKNSKIIFVVDLCTLMYRVHHYEVRMLAILVPVFIDNIEIALNSQGNSRAFPQLGMAIRRGQMDGQGQNSANLPDLFYLDSSKMDVSENSVDFVVHSAENLTHPPGPGLNFEVVFGEKMGHEVPGSGKGRPSVRESCKNMATLICPLETLLRAEVSSGSERGEDPVCHHGERRDSAFGQLFWTC